MEQWWNWGEKSQGKTSDNGRILLHYSGSVPFFFLRCGYHSDEKVGMWSHCSYEVKSGVIPILLLGKWPYCERISPKAFLKFTMIQEELAFE